MSEISFKQMLLTCPLSEIERILDIIRRREDVKQIILVTQKEHDKMDVHFKQLVERLPDEPA